MSEWPITSSRGLGVLIELKKSDGTFIFPEGRYSPELNKFFLIAKGLKQVFLGDTMKQAVEDWNTFVLGENANV